MPDSSSVPQNSLHSPEPRGHPRCDSHISLRELGTTLLLRRRLVGSVIGGMLLACLLFCLICPNQYEAHATVAMRTTPASPLSLDAPEPFPATSFLAAPLQMETLATEFRSGQLAWRVIVGLKLYQHPGFRGRFAHRFAGFNPDSPTAEAREWLLKRFQLRLHVETLPHTMLVQIRFRCRDAALSAAVVNKLIDAYMRQDSEERLQSTAQASNWLNGQLSALKQRMDQDQQRLSAFQREHGILSAPETLPNGRQAESQHISIFTEIDELSRELVVASTERILREAELQAATHGDPELVMSTDTGLRAQGGDVEGAALDRIHARQSQLEQEAAQLSVEHGPNYPRVVEIGRQLQDLDKEKKAEDTRLLARFRTSWQTALDREQFLRDRLNQRTAEAMDIETSVTSYALMRQEAISSHELYMMVQSRAEAANLAAGIHGANIAVVDAAIEPFKPVAPDLPLYMAIIFFVSLWLALGAALMMELKSPSTARTLTLLLAAVLAMTVGHAQVPTPATSGLPPGASRPQTTQDTRSQPNAETAPTVWQEGTAGAPPLATSMLQAPMPAPIAPGDFLDIGEYQTPEFHSQVRVAPDGTVKLPMVGEVHLQGLDEQAAARVIEDALREKGILLHPKVSLMVTAYAGQDVSVLGEVTHPGVYPYTLHHRLLDLLSAASGLAPSAGRLVNIFHRDDPKTAHPVVLDPGGADTSANHNPELLPGDTVQVSRAGLVYVIGDVIRPGGFPVDPAQGLTVVQALSLAWGPAPNAATTKALLIREQKGGRILTPLNVKRLLRGQEPDQPVHDRDILFIPDSTAKDLWNKSLESAIQSVLGISIYAGMVYSDRF